MLEYRKANFDESDNPVKRNLNLLEAFKTGDRPEPIHIQDVENQTAAAGRRDQPSSEEDESVDIM